MEKDDEVKKLRTQLAKLTEPTKKDEAVAEYEAAVKELAALEENIQVAQKRHNEALRKLQLVMLGKEQA